MWRSLFWKEWREQRWKAAFNTLLVTAFVAIGLRTRVISDLGVLVLAWEIAAIILPLFMSMGLVAAERAQGSLHFLLALPTRPWQTLTVKMAVGIGVVVLPFLGGVAVAAIIAGGRESTMGEIVAVALVAAWIGIQALIWFVTFAIRQPDEARAGIVAGLVFCGWCALGAGIAYFSYPGPVTLAWRMAGAIVPFEIILCLNGDKYMPLLHLILVPCIQILVSAGLCYWGLVRFSHERGGNQ